jgi:Txe/YoeB family toxin of Txe-Axe toxin-antitoxin module
VLQTFEKGTWKKAQFYPNGDSSAKHRVLSCLIGDLIRKLQIDTRLFSKLTVDLTGKKSRKIPGQQQCKR